MDFGHIEINGKKYVLADSLPAHDSDGKKYVIVRTRNAGVHAGTLENHDGKQTVLLSRARRIWKWEGAASLSQLAMEGTSSPEECKFPCEVTEITLTEAIEIIPCTEQARKSIASVPIWSA